MKLPLYRKLLQKLNSSEHIHTRKAIAKGVERGDTLADLEIIGLDMRIVNILEQSDLEIVTIEQLMSCNIDKIVNIKHLGNTQLKRLFTCLLNYDKLEKAMQQKENITQELVSKFKANAILTLQQA